MNFCLTPMMMMFDLIARLVPGALVTVGAITVWVGTDPYLSYEWILFVVGALLIAGGMWLATWTMEIKWPFKKQGERP